MLSNGKIEYISPFLKEAFESIPKVDWETEAITESIAERIDAIMKEKGISKKQLAELTHRRPSDVTRWLGGGHNFTCKTIAMIQLALGEKIVEVTK